VSKAKAELAVMGARGGPASASDVAIARLKTDAARERLDAARAAERLLTVAAPSTGTVTGLSTVPGAPVDISTPIATIADLDHLAVNVDLSEYDVARVKRNMNAVVRVDALGGKAFSGKVLFVPFAGSDNGGVVTFPVRVGLTRAAGLKPGMNVSVRVIVAQRLGVVQVPVEAVARDDEDRAMVTVAGKDGGVIERRVTTGLANNKSIEIVRGLRPGQQIVLAAAAGEEP
jgi:HlyD family secretion protein